jgi:hypothetical protein
VVVLGRSPYERLVAFHSVGWTETVRLKSRLVLDMVTESLPAGSRNPCAARPPLKKGLRLPTNCGEWCYRIGQENMVFALASELNCICWEEAPLLEVIVDFYCFEFLENPNAI